MRASIDSPRRALRLRGPALAAALWALAFAAASAYWAAGGTGGANTVAGALADRVAERDPGFVATLWAAATLKAMLAALGIALARPAHARFARPVRFAGWRLRHESPLALWPCSGPSVRSGHTHPAPRPQF